MQFESGARTAMEAGLLAAVHEAALGPARWKAFEAFRAAGLPHRRIEGWRWTDLRAALREDVGAARAPRHTVGSSAFAGLGPFVIDIAGDHIEWNGAPPAGVTVTRVPNDAPLFDEIADHPLANLVAALASERIEIAVDADIAVDQPILLRRIAGAGAAQVRVSLSLGRCARATLIETIEAGPDASFTSGLTEVRIGDGAALERLVLHDGAETAADALLFAAAIGAEARFDMTLLSLGSRIARLETMIVLEGRGARARVATASLLAAGRHADATTSMRFAAPECEARQVHRAVVAAGGRGVFQGKFHVTRAGQKTDARMNAGALLLSDAAEADHKPELEIYADDVQCAHGSAVGALDDEALFYLCQRGLDREAARALLIEAYVGVAFEAIAHPAARQAFVARAAGWKSAA